MFKLASMFVDIKADDSALKSQISGVQKQLTGFGVAVGTAVGDLAATAISAAASALTSFMAKGIAGAANLGESLLKVDATFGKSAGVIKETANELAKAYGLSKQSILDAGAAIGLIGKGVGQSSEQAAQLGSNMARLAADAASFYNVPLDEALNKIRSGLIGEAEPLRAFGVLLTEEAVAAEAVALGLAKSTKEIDNQAKIAARTSLITKGLTDASGDLERTQDSTANQYRKFTGAIENLAVAFGTDLAPATQQVILLLNELTETLTAGGEATGFWKSFGEGAADAFRQIRFHFRNFQTELRIFKLDATNWFGQNDKKIDTEVFGLLVQELKLRAEITAKEVAAALAAEDKLKAQKEAAKIAEQQAALAKQEKEAAKAEAEYAKRIADELGKKQAEHLKKQAQAAAEARRHKEDDFRSQTFGVSAFAQHLQEQIFSPQEIPRQQLEVAKKVLEKTSIIAEELQKPRGALAIMA